MTYLLKHNQNSGKASTLKRTMMILLLAVFGFWIGRLGIVQNLFGQFAQPFMQTGQNFYGSMFSVPNWFKSKSMLLEEIKRLEQERDILSLNIADLAALSYENKRLQAELGIKPEEDFVRAGVIAKSPQVPSDTLVIDKGGGSGIVIGDLVLASDRSVAGRVVEVNAKSAIVALSSSVQNTFTGIVSRTGEPFEIKGLGGGNLSGKTPIDFDIVEGDSILISYGSNYIVAVVGEVESDVPGGAKISLMSLPFSVSKVETVFILK